MREDRGTGRDGPGVLVRGKDHQNRSVVLMVGRGEPMELALRVSLDRRGLHVKSASAGEAMESTAQIAPDLVLLVGDAAKDGGEAVVRNLAENPATAVVPVALLSEDTSLDRRMRAFRSGVVAVIPRGASADGMAEQVTQVLVEVPERPGATGGELGEATLDELAEWVKKELRTGILTVAPTDGADDASPMRVVLGAGQPVAEALEAFVQRLRPLIAQAEPLRYEFQEEAGSRLGLLADLNLDDEPPADPALLEGLRILVMDSHPGRVDALATALRQRGALVGVAEVNEAALDQVGNLDPEVVLLDAEAIEGPGFEAVRRLRRDARLRWSSLLVVRWNELWPDPRSALPMDRLAGHLAPLIENDRRLSQRAAKERRFDTRLELTGPGRLLRALVRAGPTLHVVIRSPKVTLEVDLSEGLVVGAQGATSGDASRALEGTSALAALLALSAGRVHVERKGHPTVMNVMAPVDEALDTASQEDSPIPVSFRPPPAPLKTVPEDDGRAGGDDGRGKAPPASAGGSAKNTLLGTGARAPSNASTARSAGGNGAGATWDNEETEPPTDLHMIEAARRQAVRSHPPPAGGAALSSSDGGPDAGRTGGRAAAAGGSGQGGDGGDPPDPKRRKKTLVGVAPPPRAKPEERPPAPGKPPPPAVPPAKSTTRGAPPPPSPAARKAKPTPRTPEGRQGKTTPSPDQPLEMAGEPAHSTEGGADSTEELELADVLEPEEEGPQDAALADTMLPTEGMAPPPPPPPAARAASPAPPPVAASHTGAGAAGVPAEDEAETEATEILSRTSTRPASKRSRGRLVLAGMAVAVAATAAVVAWVGLGGNEEGSTPVAEGPAPAAEAEPAAAADDAADDGEPQAAELGATETEDETGEETADETADETGEETGDEEGDEGTAGDGEGDEAAAEDAAGDDDEGADETGGDDREEPAPEDEPIPVEEVANPEMESRRLTVQAMVMVQRGELDEAKEALDRAHALDDRNPRAFAGFAAYHVAKEDGEAALEWAEKAVKWRRRRAPYHVLHGDALRLTGDEKGARRAYMRALQRDSSSRDARAGLRELR